MNEITRIHLGRQPFTISIEAHRALKKYLEAIERQIGHGSTKADHIEKDEDVLQEVELRMAELLTERGISGEKVILSDDVDYLKEHLGAPSAFKDESSDGKPSEKDDGEVDESGVRRLYRDTGDRAMVAGVAAGLAAYFKVDVLIIRLLFVIFTFTGAAGIVFYILLWILVPEAKTPSEQLQMRGKAVTVDNIKRLVDRANVQGAASQVSRTARRIIRLLLDATRIFLGVTVIIFAIFLFVMIGVAAAHTFLNGVQLGGGSILSLNATERVGLVALALGLLIIPAFLCFVGAAILSRRWKMPGWLAASLVGVFVLALSTATVIGLKVAPEVRERYDRQYKTATYSLSEFKAVELQGKQTNFSYEPSNEYKVTVNYFGGSSADTVLARSLTGQTLQLRSERPGAEEKACLGLCLNNEPVSVTIYAPTLEQVTLDGEEINFQTHDGWAQKQIRFELVSGAANLNGMQASKVTVDATDVRKTVVTLDDIASDRQNYNGIYMIPRGVRVMSAPEVHLKTLGQEQCDVDGPLVWAYERVQNVRINDDQNHAIAALKRLQTDTPNVFNCVQITTSEYGY